MNDMLTIIEIRAREDGGHGLQSQSGRKECWLEGWITVPDTLHKRVWDCGGYCNLKIEDGKLVDIEEHPKPTPVDTRTAAEKRQAAYSEGYVNDTDWHIAWNEKQYTCDELSQLGMRYQFREEVAIAEEIRELVETKVGEIRAAYPDENGEGGV